MDISNREISSSLWLSAFLCWSMRRKEVRSAASSLVMAFFQWKLLVLFSVAYLYIIMCVSLLAQWNIWMNDNLKTTITWAIGFTFSTMMRINSVNSNERFFSGIARDLFTISAILTFIIELHSFGIAIELLVVPLLTFVTVLYMFTSIKDEFEQVKKFLGVVLALVGTSYVSRSMYLSFVEIEKFASIGTLREFCIPIILSLMFLPYLYLVALYFAYEQAFVMIEFAITDDKLKCAAKRRALYTFKHDYNALQRWARAVARFRPQSNTELNDLFAEARTMAIREANPPVIDRAQGWSPYAAMEFLTSEGLRMRDYSRIVDDEWSASSGYLNADSGILPNKISYYLSGTDQVATELRLMLDVSNPLESNSAETQFINVARILLSTALDWSDADLSISRVGQLKDFEQHTSYWNVSLTRLIWPGGIEGSYSLTLVIRSANHRRSEDA